MPNITFATALATLALLALPLAVVAERALSRVWTERLLWPPVVLEVPRHIPRTPTGTYLPPRIRADRTLRPADNPIILVGTTTVAAGATLTLAPGTVLAAHEFAALVVEGTLEAPGTAAQMITMMSNESHDANRLWLGVRFAPGSQGALTHVRIVDAAPALTCLPGSRVAVANSRLVGQSLAAFIQSPTCHLTDTFSTSTGLRVIELSGL